MIRPGDTVIVRRGIYREQLTLPSGKPGKPITLRAAEDERVILTGCVPLEGWKEIADGLLSTLTAVNSTTGDQVTTYVYGTEVGDTSPEVCRNDLLRAVICPDSDDTTSLGDGTDGNYDRVEYKYNRQGDKTQRKDQNATVHDYTLDKLRRLTADTATTLGTGVDGSVRRIDRSYEIRGMVEKITSYSDTSATTVVNQVVRTYNDLGMLDKEYQEHEGSKDANTLYVGYNYDDTAVSNEYTKGLRLKSVRYPNGRLVHYTYGNSGSHADNLNRLDAIKDDNSGSPGDMLAAYTYLGLGTMVVEDYQEPDLKLDYFGGTSGSYAGFDRFGRVVDQKWYDYGASADAVRLGYGYDRAGNRTWREDVAAAANNKDWDEFYTYDGLHQLTDQDIGALNAGKTAIGGTPYMEVDYSLDPLGNWAGLVQKYAGTTILDQTRTHNRANETTAISKTVGTDWADPVHDAAGNMTTMPNPASSLADPLDCSYDAFHRLVEAKDGANTIAAYEFDGLGRRISETAGGTTRHYYYSARWQVLEERLDSATVADRQFVWGGRYVDDLVLRDRDTSSPKNGVLDERLYALQDANFNVVALADTGGTVQERYTYTAYGSPTVHTATFGSRGTSTYDWEYRYTARRYDLTTGLYHYRIRPYHAQLGRFISRDPIGYGAGDPNLYRYVGGMPATLTDPTGENPLILIWPLIFPTPANEGESLGQAQGFSLCRRDLDADGYIEGCVFAIGNRLGGEHTFIQYGAVDPTTGQPLPGTEGWGLGALPKGSLPRKEKAFQPNHCVKLMRCNRRLQYGPGKDTRGVDATNQEILASIKLTPNRHRYNPVTYNCKHWAEDAIASSGLCYSGTVSNPRPRLPFPDDWRPSGPRRPFVSPPFVCFEAGTLVSTPSGKRPIEELKVNDPVLKLKMLSRVEQDHLLEFLSYSAVARAFFHAVDVIVPQFAAEYVLQLWHAWEVERFRFLRVGFCTLGIGAQVGQQEVSDQHEAKVAFYASVP